MAQLLYERTDEDHPVTMQEVIDYLEADGIRSGAARQCMRMPIWRTGDLADIIW